MCEYGLREEMRAACMWYLFSVSSRSWKRCKTAQAWYTVGRVDTVCNSSIV